MTTVYTYNAGAASSRKLGRGRHHTTVKMALTPTGNLLVQATDSGRYIATGRAIYRRQNSVVP